jgi:hypothetical protein
MEPRAIPPTERLTVTLEAATWNTVMQVLGEGPFRIVAPLIQEIQNQCTNQPAPPTLSVVKNE